MSYDKEKAKKISESAFGKKKKKKKGGWLDSLKDAVTPKTWDERVEAMEKKKKKKK